MRILRRGSIAFMFLVSTALPPLALAQVGQTDLAVQVLSDDYGASSRAVAMVSNLEPSEVGQELRTALFTALTREAAVHTRRFEAGQRNEILKPLDNPEHILALSRAVIRLKDPASIPSLSAAMFIGSAVPNALAQFGEAAVPAVLQIVTEDAAWYDAVSGGLMALRFMAEAQNEQSLSPTAIAQLRDAALRILNGHPHFTVLWRAIDLAAVLDDPALKGHSLGAGQ